MASTSQSLRFIAQRFKLSTASSSGPRICGIASGCFRSVNTARSRYSLPACTLFQGDLHQNQRCYSTSSQRHSAQPAKSAQQLSNTQSRWPPRLWSRTQYVSSIERLNHLQMRFASSQPNRDDGKVAGSPIPPSTPLTTTPIKAPEILKKALSSTPHENIYTLPNFLTFTRLLAAPAIGYFILHSQPVTALALFAYAGITDLVDGYLARRFNSQTVVGTIIDPMADKTLMTVAVVCLAIQAQIPVWLAVIVLGRDVGLAISATYYRYISLPPPKTFSRYWDFSLPSAEVRPTEISKINTFLQLLLVGNAMVLPVLPVAVVDAWNLIGVFEGWSYLVAGTTIWSGLSYVFTNDAVKILSAEESKQKQQQQQQQKKEGGL